MTNLYNELNHTTEQVELNPSKGKDAAEYLRGQMMDMYEGLEHLINEACDINYHFPEMTTADADIAMSGLIGQIRTIHEQMLQLIPMPAQIRRYTIQSEFVSLIDGAVKTFKADNQVQITFNTGDC